METITIKEKCQCECHTNPGIMHFFPCCGDGFNERIFKVLEKESHNNEEYILAADGLPGFFIIHQNHVIAYMSQRIALKDYFRISLMRDPAELPQ